MTSADTKQCFGGPYDGEWLEAPETELAALELLSGNFALYEDVGMRLNFLKVIPPIKLADDEEDMPRAQEPEL